MRIRLMAKLVAIALLVNSDPLCLAQDPVAIVVPRQYEDVEAPLEGGRNSVFQQGYRLMGVYDASEFSSLPASHRTLTGFYLRPDGPTGAATTVSWPDFTLTMSTTSVSPEELDREFAANIGPDATVVYDGPITFTTSDTGPTAGPKDFDIAFEFQTPFHYNPEQGNLLMDWDVTGPAGWTGDDRTEENLDEPIVRFISNANRNANYGSLSGFGTPVIQFVFLPDAVPGDFNLNGLLDAGDIDLLSAAVREGGNDPTYDLNEDAIVDDLDRTVWVHDLRNTWFGDANLDDDFNSRDLVLVLASGAYEADVDSDWAIGDFDGDGRTSSSDLVLALADGGYEQGPRQAAAVPEPSSVVLVTLAILTMLVHRSHEDCQAPVV